MAPLDTRMDMKVTKLPQSRLGTETIDRYNSIIITDRLSLSKAQLDNLKRWIRNGGTLLGQPQLFHGWPQMTSLIWKW